MQCTWSWFTSRYRGASALQGNIDLQFTVPSHTAMYKLANRDVRDFGWEIALEAVSRRPPISLARIVARTEGYTYAAKFWDLSIVQGPFSVAHVPNLSVTNCFIAVRGGRALQANEYVSQLAWVKQVDLTMTAQPVKALGATDMPGGLKFVKHVIAVSSCKGGVGKSTVSVRAATPPPVGSEVWPSVPRQKPAHLAPG